jgi:hypothetical protein
MKHFRFIIQSFCSTVLTTALLIGLLFSKSEGISLTHFSVDGQRTSDGSSQFDISSLDGPYSYSLPASQSRAGIKKGDSKKPEGSQSLAGDFSEIREAPIRTDLGLKSIDPAFQHLWFVGFCLESDRDRAPPFSFNS